jgi:hypothetical protein
MAALSLDGPIDAIRDYNFVLRGVDMSAAALITASPYAVGKFVIPN